MEIIGAGIYNADDGSLSIYARGMELLHSRVLVNRIVTSRGVVAEGLLGRVRGEFKLGNRPGLVDLVQLLERVGILSIRLEAEAGEDVCLEGLQDCGAGRLKLGGKIINVHPLTLVS